MILMAYAENCVCHFLCFDCQNGRRGGLAQKLKNRKCLRETFLSHEEQDKPEPVEMKVLVYLQ